MPFAPQPGWLNGLGDSALMDVFMVLQQCQKLGMKLMDRVDTLAKASLAQLCIV